MFGWLVSSSRPNQHIAQSSLKNITMHWHALHWLSVDQRIHFKLCFTGYNVQLFNQPIHVPCSPFMQVDIALYHWTLWLCWAPHPNTAFSVADLKLSSDRSVNSLMSLRYFTLRLVSFNFHNHKSLASSLPDWISLIHNISSPVLYGLDCDLTPVEHRLTSIGSIKDSIYIETTHWTSLDY